MELKVEPIAIPEKVKFNYEELRKELEAKCDEYASVVYTEEQIKMAKNDRATLNKLKDALKSEILSRKREYLIPFEDFETKMRTLVTMIDKPVKLIDESIKAFENKEKEAKNEEIKKFFESCERPEWLPYEKVFDISFLNKSVTMKKVQETILAKIDKVNNDLQMLSELPEFGFEATELYKTNLDVYGAINEGKRLAFIQQKKQESILAHAKAQEEAQKAQEAPKTTEPIQEPIEAETTPSTGAQWVAFEAYLTMDASIALKRFFEEHQIQFRPIQQKGE